MRRDIGPDGNDIFEYDTVGGVPAFTYMSIASRILTQKGRQRMRPDYGADFLSCVSQDDPLNAICSEVSSALGDDLKWNMEATQNLDDNTAEVELSGWTESGDNWSLTFGVDLNDGSVTNFPPFVVDGREQTVTSLSAQRIQDLESALQQAVNDIHRAKEERRATDMDDQRLEERLNSIVGDLEKCLRAWQAL